MKSNWFHTHAFQNEHVTYFKMGVNMFGNWLFVVGILVGLFDQLEMVVIFVGF